MEEKRVNPGIILAWAGWLIATIITRFVGEFWLLSYVIGLVLASVGCVLWAQYKNRHWAFGFWGLLAPIGFLGVSLLKDKYKSPDKK